MRETSLFIVVTSSIAAAAAAAAAIVIHRSLLIKRSRNSRTKQRHDIARNYANGRTEAERPISQQYRASFVDNRILPIVQIARATTGQGHITDK